MSKNKQKLSCLLSFFRWSCGKAIFWLIENSLIDCFFFLWFIVPRPKTCRLKPRFSGRNTKSIGKQTETKAFGLALNIPRGENSKKKCFIFISCPPICLVGLPVNIPNRCVCSFFHGLPRWNKNFSEDYSSFIYLRVFAEYTTANDTRQHRFSACFRVSLLVPRRPTR